MWLQGPLKFSWSCETLPCLQCGASRAPAQLRGSTGQGQALQGPQGCGGQGEPFPVPAVCPTFMLMFSQFSWCPFPALPWVSCSIHPGAPGPAVAHKCCSPARQSQRIWFETLSRNLGTPRAGLTPDPGDRKWMGILHGEPRFPSNTIPCRALRSQNPAIHQLGKTSESIKHNLRSIPTLPSRPDHPETAAPP